MFRYVLLLIAGFGSVSLAQVNTQDATLKSVVVVRDVVELNFIPHFVQSAMGDLRDMKTDPSCATVRVQDKFIYCVSSEGKSIFVGLLDSIYGSSNGWEVISIKWFATAEISETKDAQGGLSYSVRVK